MKGRQRGRNGGKPRMHHQGGGGRNPNFDHNAGRMRGNAQQLMDKFLALGRDAASQGDRVLAENYFQHADHYYRVLNARFEGQQQQRRFNGPHQHGGFDGPDAAEPLNDFGRPDIPPGPSQNLIPPGTAPVEAAPPPAPAQPQPQPQPQPAFDPMYQPQPAAPEADGEIGLPPQLFGGQPQPPAPPAAEPPAAGGQERGFRPRHAGRRRFGGRQGQPPQSAGEAS
jgi:hypothetical protein